jgi:hypothetical protein
MLHARGVGVLGTYLLISIVLFAAYLIAAGPGRFYIGGHFGDPAMMMWYLVWWPYAVWHRIDPFITYAVWPSAGYNLTWATSIPAVAAAFAPITAAFGPVVAYNAASVIAPALSAYATFLLGKKLTNNTASAFLGGIIYGFSPYEVGEIFGGHLHLTFNFIPPLCVLLLIMLLQGDIRPARFTVVLCLALVCETFISTEVLATMTLFGALAFALACLTMRRWRRGLIGAVPLVCMAYVSAAIVVSPFLYYVFIKGSPPKEPLLLVQRFSADLTSFVVPGPLMLLNRFGGDVVNLQSAGNLSETGSYVGIPLLAIAIFWFWRHRRDAAARLLCLLLVLVLTAAMGPVLEIGNHWTMPLPWALMTRIQLIKHALPVRLVNYAFLSLAIVFCFCLSEPVRWKKVIVCAILLAFFPNPLLFLHPCSYDPPSFFADGLYRKYLRRNDNLLVIPFAINGPSLAWQAQAWMYFRMPGGYFGTIPEYYRRWPIINTLLTSIPVATPAAQLQAFAAAEQVDAIVVTGEAKGAAAELPSLLGIKALQVGGVSLYPLTASVADPANLPPIEELQRSAAETWFLNMLCTAQRYVVQGHHLSGLDPVKAHELGLLPDSWWNDNLDTLVGLFQWGDNGLWIGPGPDGTVAVGVPASGFAARDLAARYKEYATRVLYPYPSEYNNRVVANDDVHFLLMNLRSAALRRCALSLAKWPSMVIK